jgi:RNA polymerase sigma factor (sigma-70 family)
LITLSMPVFTNNQEKMEIGRNYSDTQVTESIHSGGNLDAVIRYLYKMNFERVQGYIVQNSGSQQDAEDVFQEVIVTFIELVQQGKFRGESSITTFLLAISRNIWLNELKKRGRSNLRDEKFEKSRSIVDQDVSKYMVNREMRMQVMDLLGKLGDKCKKILVAYYYENLSMKEILQQFDYENEQVVRNRKYKCLKQLEQVFAAKPGLANNLRSILSYE